MWSICLIFIILSLSVAKQLGLEPRELSKIERYGAEDMMDFNNRGYIYSYERKIGPIISKIIAKTDQMGNILSTVQTK